MTVPFLRLKEVYRSIGVSVLGSLAIQAMLLISGILAARLLGVANRGHLALFLLFVVVLAQLAGSGLPLATTYCIARDRSTARAVVSVVTMPAIAQALVAVCAHALILLIVFGHSSASLRFAAALTLLATPTAVIHQYVLGVFQGQHRFRAFNIFRFLPSVLYSAVLVVAFATRTHALVIVTAAWVASLIVTVCVGLGVMFHGLPTKIPEQSAISNRSEMLSFGLRGMLGSIAPLETFNLDQAAVGLFISPAALGLYVVGLSFTNLPQFLAQSVGYVAYPHVAAKRDPIAARHSMWRFLGLTLVLSGAAVVLLELAAPWLVVTFFGRSYASSATLTRILLIGALFIGLRRVLTDGARGGGHPTLGTVAELVSLAVLLPALALLVASGGAHGAAWAVVLSSAIGLLFLGVAVAAAPNSVPSLAARQDVQALPIVPGSELSDGLIPPYPAGTPTRLE